MSQPTSGPPKEFLFMGEQEDVELRNWIARGIRVYDGTDSADARCPECKREVRIRSGTERWCLPCHEAGREVKLVEVVP